MNKELRNLHRLLAIITIGFTAIIILYSGNNPQIYILSLIIPGIQAWLSLIWFSGD